MNERELAVLCELGLCEDGATGPELAKVARRFGVSSGMFEWASPKMKALAEMGYAEKLERKRQGAWVWIITDAGRALIQAGEQQGKEVA